MSQAPDKSFQDRDQEARDVLKKNDMGGYTVPNKSVYPFQWNWDSAFVAMGFAQYDLPRAWRELQMLFVGQWTDGMIPSIAFHREADHYYPGPSAWDVAHEPPTTGITQPPVAATAARVVFNAEPDRAVALERLGTVIDPLYASHRWWHTVRDPESSGLVTIVHPWETGRDNSPDWDAPLAAITPKIDVSGLRKDNKVVDPSERPTNLFYNRVMSLVEEGKALGWDGKKIATSLSMRVCDLGIQSILLRADLDLLALCEALGRDEQARELRSWIDRSTYAFKRLKAPDGSYRSLDLITGQLAPCATSASFLPLYAKVVDAEEARTIVDLLMAWDGVAPFGVASSDPFHASYDPRRYWRGPSWTIVNRMIADGLAAYGFVAEAASLRRASSDCIRRQGFWEYFDPRKGQGLGGRDVSWTAAMWLAWAGRDAANDEKGLARIT